MTDKQDCSTCTTPHRVENGLSRHPQFYCNGLELPFDTLWVMSKRGCASHSDFQSERDCIWMEDEDGIYQTCCGNSFEFMEGTPERNHIKFCPYCGKVLTQSKEGEL